MYRLTHCSPYCSITIGRHLALLFKFVYNRSASGIMSSGQTPIINTPLDPSDCSIVDLTWAGGTAPYNLFVSTANNRKCSYSFPYSPRTTLYGLCKWPTRLC